MLNEKVFWSSITFLAIFAGMMLWESYKHFIG